MAEFDDSFSEDHYSDFNRGLTQIKSSYNSNDGLWSHSASIAVANFENDNFNAGSPNGGTELSKQNYSYIGSRYWEVANQRLSLALKRIEKEFKQFGGWATEFDANRFVERNTDGVALEYRFDPNDSITLALSSRYEDNDQFKSSTTQRFEALPSTSLKTDFEELGARRLKIQPLPSFMVSTGGSKVILILSQSNLKLGAEF